jgi:DNA-binding SARP family transcriptional activator
MHVHTGQAAPGQAAAASGLAATAMFGILGPLVVDQGGGASAAPASGTLPGRVLAALILHAGSPCGTGWIAGAVWGQQLPADAPGAVRTVVAGLRRSLGTLRPRLESAESGGYVFRAAPEETDLGRFRSMAQLGRQAWYRSDVTAAARSLAAAAAQWREPALADVPDTELLRPVRCQLARERADVQDLLVDARLALGEHDAVISELRSTVAADPLREHAWAQLMRALHRSGQPAAALEAYQEARAALHQGHGMAPGPEIAELRRRLAGGEGTRQAAAGNP